MKKFLMGFICGLILMTGGIFAATELNVVANPFPVLINDVESVVEGYNINGFTFLKLADFKQTGLVIKFNETDRQIEVTSDASNSVSFRSVSGLELPDFTVPEIPNKVTNYEFDPKLGITQYIIGENKITKYNEIEYIKVADILSKNLKSYIITKVDDTTMRLTFGNRIENKIIIVPFIYINGKSYVPFIEFNDKILIN